MRKPNSFYGLFWFLYLREKNMFNLKKERERRERIFSKTLIGGYL